MLLSLIVIFSLLGSIGAVALSGSFLIFPRRVRLFFIPFLISYASGALLAVALLDLIPRSLESVGSGPVFYTVLAGLISFFVLEKLVIWRHCHREVCEVHKAAGPLLLVGDAFHNFGDGIAIGAAFLVSIPLGIATSLAVMAHEIPQEVGDFVILLESGYPRRRALLLNALSGLTTLPGALLAYASLRYVEAWLPYIVALAAAGFIYIAMADLFPALHRTVGPRQTIYQLVSIICGAATMILLGFIE